MKQIFSNFLRMESSFSTPPIRTEMRSLFLAMLFLIAGVGNVLGADATDTVAMKGFANITASGYQNQTKTGQSKNEIEMVAYGFNGSTGQVRGNKTAIAGASVTSDDKDKNWSLYNSEAMPGAISKIEVTQTATGDNKFQNTLYVSLGTSSQGAVTAITNAQAQDNTSGTQTITFTIDATKNYTYFKLLSTAKFTSQSVADVKVIITYDDGQGESGSEKTAVIAEPKSLALPSDEGEGTIALTYSNLGEEYLAEVSLYSDEEGKNEFTGDWLTADFTTKDDYSEITYLVEANTGAARTAYIKVYATDGDTKEATTIIPVSQAEYSAPTGTFELFSGDIEEGDYVIVGKQTSSGKYFAMNNTVTSNQYLGITEVTISENTISNPDASLIWTIEKSSGGNYYIINGSNYLDDNATSNKNYAQLVTETSNTSEWTIKSSDSKWAISNVGNTDKNVLSFNIGNARVACYGAVQSGNDGIYLYKKEDGKPKAPTFTPAAGSYVGNQSITLTTATEGAKIYYTTDGTTPTTESTLYTEAFTLSASATVKAIAVKDAVSSSEASATYNICPSYTNTAETAYTPSEAIAIYTGECYVAEKVYVKGVVTSATIQGTGTYANTYNVYVRAIDDASADPTTYEFYNMYKNAEKETFTDGEIKAGDIITAYGVLSKYENTKTHAITYEFASGCYMVEYEAYTEPKVSINNTLETAYTVAEAITKINDVTSDLDGSDEVYVKGVVKSTNNSKTIFIKDAEADNEFQLYKANWGEFEVEENDTVTAKGKILKYNSNYEMAEGGVVVALQKYVAPTIAVTSVALTESTASIEMGETVTLHASVLPENATNNTIVWSVQSGSEYASVDNGVVTGIAAGEAVIRAASDEDASIYAECTVTVTAADPTVHKVTFDATIDIASDNDNGITKNGITVKTTHVDGVNDNSSAISYYQTFKNATLTITSTVGNITKIEFTCESSNPASGFGTAYASGVWTGDAAEVVLTATEKQVRINTITVTYKEDNRTDAGLAWNPVEDVEITVGDAFTAPALANPNNIAVSEISIESDNTALATVTAGVVSLVENATGTATITATFDGNDDYKPATISYTITVNAPAPEPTAIYNKVPSGAYLTSGEYLLVYEDGNVAFNGALATLDATSNTVAVTISDDKISGTETIDAATFTIDVAAGTIKSASGKYIGQASDANGLKASGDELVNTLSIDADSNFVVVSAGGAYLRYNASSGQERFRYFKSSTYTTQKAIQLYKKGDLELATYTRDVTSGNYGTICLPYAGTIEGATLFDIASCENEIIYMDEVEGNAMEAGKPYIFQATDNQLNVTYTSATAVAAGEANGLYGFYALDNMATDNAAQVNITEDAGNYILYQNQYWLVSGRAAYINNFRAYIKIAEINNVAPAPGRRRVAMTVNAEQVATGVEELNAAEKPVKVLMNGQLFILRGEKLYDATGRLVK